MTRDGREDQETVVRWNSVSEQYDKSECSIKILRPPRFAILPSSCCGAPGLDTEALFIECAAAFYNVPGGCVQNNNV